MGEKVIRSNCGMCHSGCGILAHVRDGKLIKVEGDPNCPWNKGTLCAKGLGATQLVYNPERLKYPMKRLGGRGEGKWQRISWDEALDTIAGRIKEIREKDGPLAVAVASGTARPIFPWVRRFCNVWGTPNRLGYPHNCYTPRIAAGMVTYGSYLTYDVEDSKCIVVWGKSITHSRPCMDGRLFIEAFKKGCKVICVDPYLTPVAARSDIWLQIRPGTDCAMALAWLNVITEEKLFDKEFVQKWTYGFDKLAEHVEAFTPEWAEKITWVPVEDIRKLARLYATAKGASIHQGTNTQDQTANGTQNSRAFAILQTITGNINNRGGWVVSPRLILTGLGLPTERTPIGAEDYSLFYEIWGRKSPYGQVVCFPDSVPDVIKALIVTGGNPVVSMPDSNAFREALKRLELLVVLDFFMTETAELAHYVLPGCTHLEKNGLAYSYNVCHGVPYLMLRKKAIEPLYESRSEFTFWKELAKKMGFGEVFPWESDEEVVELELKSTGLSYKELKEEKIAGAYYMEKKYGLEGYEVKGFPTPSKKIEIYSETFEKAGFDPLPTYREPDQSPLGDPKLFQRFPLILTTGARNLYYTHSQHRNIQGLKEKNPEPYAEIHTKTAEKFGIKDGDPIIVESNRGHIKVKALVTQEMLEGVVSIPHGWSGEANVNLLTDVHCREPIMGYPQMKSQLCSIRKA